MRTIETIAELQHQVRVARDRGERIGFVPTMGALHAGHAALIRVAHAQCDLVIASAFVNPLQFGAGEDFERYPTTPDNDRIVAADAGADLLWVPLREELTPASMQFTIDPGPIATVLCGAERPGHFAGVATIVARLIGLVRPDVLYLGEKDWQQLVIVRRLVEELALAVEVRAVPTVRDADGLALSSRNAYLSAQSREAATALGRALEAARDAVAGGERSVGRLRARVEVTLAEAADIDVRYVEIVDENTLEQLDTLDRPARLMLAATVAGTRLIDNVQLTPAEVPATVPATTEDASPAHHTHDSGDQLEFEPSAVTESRRAQGPWQ